VTNVYPHCSKIKAAAIKIWFFGGLCHELERRLRDFYYCRLRRIGWGLQASVKKTAMRGADELPCGVQRFSTNINGTAAFCRPDMPHTLCSTPDGFPQISLAAV